MKPISADSHIVEGPEVFTGLTERFGDDAPRIMDVGDDVDCIVIPSRGVRGVSVARMCMAATRLARNEPLPRKPGHKPDVAHMNDPELVALFNKGYEGMRIGLRDGAHRYEDQDIDGLGAEFLYPGFFAMFGFENIDLLVACQKNYNDWLHDYATASNNRVYGLAAIPIQDPNAAKLELERVLEMGFRGGCIPCTSPAGRPYYDLAYEPIWSLAEEANFPISMHVGCNSHVPSEYRHRGKQRRDAIADYAASQGVVQRTLVELMCRGVAER
ncbi:MAG: amidohydrolase family protein, partial [Gammaproteobacteria bacterium]|nr:amidohydrolase family protein [Gammaproteobacteria bacterium]